MALKNGTQERDTVAVKQRTVVVNDRMQQGYRYVLVAPVGRNFDPDFRPELTPPEMLRLGVFGGKYLTDCRDEFPASWFARAKLSPERSDAKVNFFGVAASQPLSVWRKQGLDTPRRPSRLVSMVLPLLSGSAAAGRRRTADQTLGRDPQARPSTADELRAGRCFLPEASTAGAAALGL